MGYTHLLTTLSHNEAKVQCVGYFYSIKSMVSYSSYSSGFVCHNCNSDQNYEITDEGIDYLQLLSTANPSEVRKAIIQENTLQNLKDFLLLELQKNIGIKLQTLEAGMSIL